MHECPVCRSPCSCHGDVDDRDSGQWDGCTCCDDDDCGEWGCDGWCELCADHEERRRCA